MHMKGLCSRFQAGDGLQGNDARLYEFVARHFLACCSQNAEVCRLCCTNHRVSWRCELTRAGVRGRALRRLSLPSSEARNSRPAGWPSGHGTTWTFTRTRAGPRTPSLTSRLVCGCRWRQAPYPPLRMLDIHCWANVLTGQRFQPTNLELSGGQTAPPEMLAEADLIALMDANGIGTDATIAEHIATVLKREYVLKSVCWGHRVHHR